MKWKGLINQTGTLPRIVISPLEFIWWTVILRMWRCLLMPGCQPLTIVPSKCGGEDFTKLTNVYFSQPIWIKNLAPAYINYHQILLSLSLGMKKRTKNRHLDCWLIHSNRCSLLFLVLVLPSGKKQTKKHWCTNACGYMFFFIPSKNRLLFPDTFHW